MVCWAHLCHRLEFLAQTDTEAKPREGDSERDRFLCLGSPGRAFQPRSDTAACSSTSPTPAALSNPFCCWLLGGATLISPKWRILFLSGESPHSSRQDFNPFLSRAAPSSTAGSLRRVL